jgi:hypothetical protein
MIHQMIKGEIQARNYFSLFEFSGPLFTKITGTEDGNISLILPMSSIRKS